MKTILRMLAGLGFFALVGAAIVLLAVIDVRLIGVLLIAMCTCVALAWVWLMGHLVEEMFRINRWWPFHRSRWPFF